MEGKLAENIRALRKEKKMTQEQLAECLDVTVGAVSKWESGATTPDLSMIMELAHFFAVSVDALLGYQWQNSSLEQTLERLKKLRQQRDYEQAIQLGEKELRRYPNLFSWSISWQCFIWTWERRMIKVMFIGDRAALSCD